MRIEQIMRHDPTRVGQDEPVSRLIEWYANPGGHSRYTYVVDGDGKLLGVVTMMEILGLFIEKDVVDGQEKGIISDAEALRRVSCALDEKKDLPVSRIMFTISPPRFKTINSNLMMLSLQVGNFAGPVLGAWMMHMPRP